jgi:hypothetical protein
MEIAGLPEQLEQLSNLHCAPFFNANASSTVGRVEKHFTS